MTKPLIRSLSPHFTVWLLAVAPLLGIATQALIANLFALSFNGLWVMTISLNITLALYDLHCLKNRNQYQLEMGNPLLIPLYLQKRATLLNQPFGYVLVWYGSLAVVVLTPSWEVTSFFHGLLQNIPL